jgi:hypothetical protein
MKKLCLFFSLAILLGACSRSERRPLPPAAPPEDGAAEAARPLPPATPRFPDDLLYVPSRDRVLMHNDADPVETSWISLGMDIPTLLPKIMYGLLIAECPLLDGNRNPRGEILPRGVRVKVLEAGDWEATAGGYRRLEIPCTFSTGATRARLRAMLLPGGTACPRRAEARGGQAART